MSSLFVAFCFAKTVTGNDNYITGTALYQINDNTDEFREITFKGFTKNPDSLVIPFEKNSIILIVGHYVYKENVEYIYINFIIFIKNIINSTHTLLFFLDHCDSICFCILF
ncbi:hypothetical protein C2G38_2084173 [Gigaspora rosea]|uniref:Uncharacterized protein n=1 Tax=Gigaspora rosea TaxID=44941 RepID=A0A397VGI8_9GLOM|nr:hypothetical protein C2G38_2084173 [Gigaspora rosea]